MRRTFRFAVPLVAGLIAASSTLTFAATLRSGNAADVPRGSEMRDLGRAPAMLPVSIAVTLNYQHEAELGQLVHLQGDRRSPVYHHFLSNAQFNNYFAATPQTYASVIATLQRAGFRVTQTYPNRTLVDATAPAFVAERFFQTEIHRVVQTGAGLRYANVRPALMPKDVPRCIVGSVLGSHQHAGRGEAGRYRVHAMRRSALPSRRALKQMLSRSNARRTLRRAPRRKSAYRRFLPICAACSPTGPISCRIPVSNRGATRSGARCGTVNAVVTTKKAHTRSELFRSSRWIDHARNQGIFGFVPSRQSKPQER